MSTRIPQTIPAFNAYIRNAYARLMQMVQPDPNNPPVTVWQWLGLTQAQMDAFLNLWLTPWIGPNGNNGLYSNWSNPQFKGKPVNQAVEDFLPAFGVFFGPLL